MSSKGEARGLIGCLRLEGDEHGCSLAGLGGVAREITKSSLVLFIQIGIKIFQKVLTKVQL